MIPWFQRKSQIDLPGQPMNEGFVIKYLQEGEDMRLKFFVILMKTTWGQF